MTIETTFKNVTTFSLSQLKNVIHEKKVFRQFGESRQFSMASMEPCIGDVWLQIPVKLEGNT